MIWLIVAAAIICALVEVVAMLAIAAAGITVMRGEPKHQPAAFRLLVWAGHYGPAASFGGAIIDVLSGSGGGAALNALPAAVLWLTSRHYLRMQARRAVARAETITRNS